MNYFSFKIYLRKKATLKNGKHPVYLRVTANRKSKEFKIPVECFPEQWDENTLRVKGRSEFALKANSIINSTIHRASEIIYQYQIGKEIKTVYDFADDFSKKHPETVSFFEYAENYVEKRKHNFSKETIRSYNSYISKLKSFQPKLSFQEITENFLHQYNLYMIENLNNSMNTRQKNISFIKRILDEAIKEKLITKNAAKNIPVKRVPGDRAFLTKKELDKLDKLYNELSNKKLKDVLRCFLFSCYTGLRYRDIKNLRLKHIQNNMIILIMHKTKRKVSIPLSKRALNLIDTNTKYPFQPLFKVMSNQKLNQYLKDIAKIAGIDKHLTFHVARHTFATVSIELGIPIEVVSRLLGHSDIKTTQIYARIVDNVKIREMQKWNF